MVFLWLSYGFLLVFRLSDGSLERKLPCDFPEAGFSGRDLHGMALSPDGGTLAVADCNRHRVHLVRLPDDLVGGGGSAAAAAAPASAAGGARCTVTSFGRKATDNDEDGSGFDYPADVAFSLDGKHRAVSDNGGAQLWVPSEDGSYWSWLRTVHTRQRATGVEVDASGNLVLLDQRGRLTVYGSAWQHKAVGDADLLHTVQFAFKGSGHFDWVQNASLTIDPSTGSLAAVLGCTVCVYH
jgi:sugar lactone lactonase YvrE